MDEECATGCYSSPIPIFPPPPCCKKIVPPPTEEPKEQAQLAEKCFKNSDCPQGTECRGADDCPHTICNGFDCMGMPLPLACLPKQG